MPRVNIIFENIAEDSYRKLINYAFDNCDSVGFLFRRYHRRQTDELLRKDDKRELERYISASGISAEELEQEIAEFDAGYDAFMETAHGSIIKRSFGPKWPSIVELYVYEMKEDDVEGIICFCSDELRDYMLSKTSIEEWIYPKFPEDVCFFKNGREWFVSCTHEEDAFVNTEDINDLLFLEEIGVLYDGYLMKI